MILFSKQQTAQHQTYRSLYMSSALRTCCYMLSSASNEQHYRQFTCPHMGLPWHQLQFVRDLSCAEPVSLDQQAAAVPSLAGLLPVCTCSPPGWQRRPAHTLDSHMRCQAPHKPCAASPASSLQLRHPRSLHSQRGLDSETVSADCS